MNEVRLKQVELCDILRRIFITRVDEEVIEALKYLKENLQSEELKKLFDLLQKDEDFEELTYEINRIYYQGSVVPTSASVFLSDKRLMMQEEAIKVAEIYKEWELDTSKFKDVPDYIGFEMEFLYFLFALSEESKNKDMTIHNEVNEAIDDFIKNHIFNWIDMFIKESKEETEDKFVVGLLDKIEVLRKK